MNPGDILIFPADSGIRRGGKPVMFRFRCKCLSVVAEVFRFEFIEGPLDGQDFSMTRAELDKIQGRKGGDDWKQPPK